MHRERKMTRKENAEGLKQLWITTKECSAQIYRPEGPALLWLFFQKKIHDHSRLRGYGMVCEASSTAKQKFPRSISRPQTLGPNMCRRSDLRSSNGGQLAPLPSHRPGNLAENGSVRTSSPPRSPSGNHCFIYRQRTRRQAVVQLLPRTWVINSTPIVEFSLKSSLRWSSSPCSSKR